MIDNNKRKLENEAEQLFGNMRNATKKEQESVNDYINKISTDTDINFFDLCEKR